MKLSEKRNFLKNKYKFTEGITKFEINNSIGIITVSTNKVIDKDLLYEIRQDGKPFTVVILNTKMLSPV